MKRFELPNWMLLHWILNPGLVINELVLGQRLPKLTLTCTECALPLPERSYVPCPHCNTVHEARIWGGRNAFGNWRGYVCPTCNTRIPAIWNLTSLVVLALLSPVWYPFYRFYFKDRPPSPPIQTPGKPLRTINKAAGFRMGLTYGFLMWLLMSAVPATVEYFQTGEMNVGRLIQGGEIYLVAGAAFGLIMYLYLIRKGKRRNT